VIIFYILFEVTTLHIKTERQAGDIVLSVIRKTLRVSFEASKFHWTQNN